MLKIISTPKSPDILNRDGSILKATSIIILGCIVYSVLTEFTFFFFSIVSYIKLSPWLSYPIGLMATIFLIYLIEAKGIEFMKYVWDCVLYGRIKEDVFMFLFSVAIVFCCYAVSYNISIYGIPSISKKFVEIPIMGNTFLIDSTKNKDVSEVLTTYTNDSLLIGESYHSQIELIRNEYRAKITKEQTNVTLYKRKEQRTEKSYQSRITYHKGKIETLKANREKAINEKEILKANELKTLLTERKNSIKEIKDTHQADKRNIENKNTNKETNYKTELESTTGGMSNGCLLYTSDAADE